MVVITTTTTTEVREPTLPVRQTGLPTEIQHRTKHPIKWSRVTVYPIVIAGDNRRLHSQCPKREGRRGSLVIWRFIGNYRSDGLTLGVSRAAPGACIRLIALGSSRRDLHDTCISVSFDLGTKTSEKPFQRLITTD